jgi:PAS domain S-box-containing protein
LIVPPAAKIASRGSSVQSEPIGGRDEFARAFERSDVTDKAPIDTFWLEAPCGLLSLGPDFRISGANPAALAMIGRTEADLGDASFFDFLSPADKTRFLNSVSDSLAAPDVDVEVELTLVAPGRSERHVDVALKAARDRRQINLCFRNAEKRRAERDDVTQKLQDAELAATIVASSNDAILSCAADGSILSWNQGAVALYGYPPEEAIGQSISFVVPEDRKDESADRFRSVCEGNRVYLETERLHKSGARVPVAISGAPIYQNDRVIGISAVHRDIRAHVRHEAQMQFVMRELAHRTKNLLAIIQSIERQTARSVATTEDFHERFSSRLQALAASHDLLVDSNWAGAKISDLVERQLAPFSDQIGNRIHAEGAALKLSPSVAQTLGLALHELATNATKYGALSEPKGRVDITWGIISEKGETARFRIDWRETGGPFVKPPTKRGFGLLAIERLAAQAVDGEAEVDFEEHGLHWRLSSDPSRVERD